MGNTCVGPKLNANGFLQSVSAAVWRNQKPDESLKSNTDDSSRKKSVTGGDDALDPPPAAVPTPSTPPPPVKMATEEAPKSIPTETNNNDANPKTNKEAQMKRMASAGLQIDSVLGRKTENLKDIYSVGRKLGQGQFGTTFLCVDKKTNKEFACKTIAKRKLTTPEDVEDVRREIHIMHHLSGHPNVIQIVGAYEDAVAVHVVMDICAGGELFDRIIQRGHYTERKAAELARIIVGVIEACHSLGVMHRDLKPENFLFVNGDEDAALKTIDFGLSVFFKPGETFSDVVGSLRMTTSTRLKACLYSFTSPGGPMYPTRAVRHAAWDALDSLFPVGRYPRHLISLFFRLLYPWYWPSSCWNFVVSCIKAVLYSIVRLIFSRRENPRQS